MNVFDDDFKKNENKDLKSPFDMDEGDRLDLNAQPPQRNYPPQKKESKAKIYVIVAIIALVASFVGSALGDGLFQNNVVLFESVTAPMSESGTNSYAGVVQSVETSVVEITTEDVTTGFFGNYITQGAGSGVIISSDGYIVTNHHVIDGADNILVRLSDKTEYKAILVGSDIKTDLAVLKIEKSGLKPAVFADSDLVQVGDQVIAVGNPLGELGGSVTNGIISALDREIVIDNQNMTLLQTNTAINPGNSGGGLFSMNGELIAIVNAKSTGAEIDNIGFAIPSNIAKKVVADIIENGYVTNRPTIGITVVAISSYAEAEQYGFPSVGVFVETSTRTEFKKGDMIYSIDSVVIKSSADISTILSKKQVGDSLEFVVMREGKPITFSLELIASSQN